MLFYDDLQTISVFDLMKKGFLKPDTETEVTIILTTRIEPPKEVLLFINTKQPTPFIKLTYDINGKLTNYNINLLSEPFRLNHGLSWYFVCPVTGIRCQKLHFANGYFQHRTAINGTYFKKTIAPNLRSVLSHSSKITVTGKMLVKVTAPYFRKTYAHKPTKAYTRLISLLH